MSVFARKEVRHNAHATMPVQPDTMPPVPAGPQAQNQPTAYDERQNAAIDEILANMAARIDDLARHAHIVPVYEGPTKTDIIQYGVIAMLIIIVVLLMSRR